MGRPLGGVRAERDRAGGTNRIHRIDSIAVSGRQLVHWVIGCGLVLVLGVAATAALTVDQFRERALRSSERELSNTVLLLARHFDQQISQIRNEEKDFVGQLRAAGIDTPEDFAREMASAKTHALLQDKVKSTSDVATIAVFDSEGRLLNSSEPGDVPAVSIADQPCFQALKLPLSNPFDIELIKSKLFGRWEIVLVRRVVGPNGAFLGVVSQGIMPDTLERFFASVALGENSAVSMFKRDGTLLARYPHVEGAIGTNFSIQRDGLLDTARRDGKSVKRNVSPIDGMERLGAARALSEYPIMIAATTTMEAALAGWRAETRFLIIIAAVLALVIAAMQTVVVRQIKRQYRASRQRLTLEKRRLDTAIHNMPQGLVMFDASGRLIVSNQRYLEMFALSGDIVKPGCTLRELMNHRKERGLFADDIDSYCAKVEDQLRRGEPSQWIMHPGDGRSIQVVFRPAEDGGWVTTLEDVTGRRRAEERIAHLAHYDSLTDLPNRVLFRERLEARLAAEDACAVIYLDIDEFKSINDSLGHSVGDELLRTVARRLRDCVAEDGFVARLGGDEFAIIPRGAADCDAVAALVGRLHDAIRVPCDCFGHQISTDASIGAALAPLHGRELDELLTHADLAMYAAKADGRRTWRMFEPAMDARVKTRQRLEQDLRQIISTRGFGAGGFEIHYQPLVCLEGGHVTGCEALLRWNHPERGAISPAEFIPVAEDTGLISQLGEWVLSSACREAASWPDSVKLAVNVSPVQFRSPTLALRVVTALTTSGLAAARLELEITEAVLIRDDDCARAMLEQLRALGVRTALDDFGTGYSSLSYLQRFPFDKIKIDRSFVTRIAETDGSAPIVEAVIRIATSRAMSTTAEGVETEAQRDLLRALGCREMQGWLFSPARPAHEIRALLASHATAAGAAA